MFDFQRWIRNFQDHFREHGQAYNDAVGYGVTIEGLQNRLWRVLGIHHLTPEENKGNHHVYIEVLGKDGKRDGQRAVHWTWDGRLAGQPAPDLLAGHKPADELVNIPLHMGMVVNVWTTGGDVAAGFSANHPDEGDKLWNSVGHHSFFVCFQAVDLIAPGPAPLPEPGPPTEPEPPGDERPLTIKIKKAWLDQMRPDADGYIILDFGF